MGEHIDLCIAELDGFEAFVAGEDAEANPFDAESASHIALLRGWKEAERKHVR